MAPVAWDIIFKSAGLIVVRVTNWVIQILLLVIIIIVIIASIYLTSPASGNIKSTHERRQAAIKSKRTRVPRES